MLYNIVESYQEKRPEEVDLTSSKTKVYLRRNITEVPNTESAGNHWRMEEAELTREEYEQYISDLQSPMYELLMQRSNDITANQELSDITTEANHEEQMQLLNDIQADILLSE